MLLFVFVWLWLELLLLFCFFCSWNCLPGQWLSVFVFYLFLYSSNFNFLVCNWNVFFFIISVTMPLFQTLICCKFLSFVIHISFYHNIQSVFYCSYLFLLNMTVSFASILDRTLKMLIYFCRFYIKPQFIVLGCFIIQSYVSALKTKFIQASINFSLKFDNFFSHVMIMFTV